MELYLGIGLVVGFLTAIAMWFEEKRANRSLLMSFILFQLASVAWPLALIWLILRAVELTKKR